MQFVIAEVAKKELVEKFNGKTLRILPKTRT